MTRGNGKNGVFDIAVNQLNVPLATSAPLLATPRVTYLSPTRVTHEKERAPTRHQILGVSDIL